MLVAMMTNRLRVMDSLLRKIKISRTRFYRGSGCWEWQAVKTNGGYGHIYTGEPVKKLAHRRQRDKDRYPKRYQRKT